jgi:hypothetical protein
MTMEDGALNHSLLLAFDSDEPAFARGFELGRIWTLLQSSPDDEVSEHAHASNAEMLLRMAEATGRQLHTVDLDDTWVLATYAASTGLDST